MKKSTILIAGALVLSACDAKVTPIPSQPDKVIEKDTTEKKVENNTTIVNPTATPAAQEQKTTTTTTETK